MIFSTIDKVESKADFSFFEELILIYCKIVREICAKNGITYSPTPTDITKSIVEELIDMGVVADEEQIKMLKSKLKGVFVDFIYSVSIYLSHKSLFGNLLDKLNNKKRKELQEKEMQSGKPTVVDFFAGAGGLSIGFVQNNFRVSFANDFEEVCVNTYKYNHPEIPSNKVLKADIRGIVDNIDEYVKEDIDVVVGGPPCQGFSSANQQRIIDDPRNELYKYYLKAIEKIAPKIVVMENVRGMLSVADQVVEDYENLKAVKNGVTYTYTIKYELLNSANFGVAQSRERLIYIAIRNDVAESKGITPSDIFEEIKQSCVGKKGS